MALRPATDRPARHSVPSNPGDSAAREIDRFIDRYLDVRLQGCCLRHGHGRCGHVLLEVTLSSPGKVVDLQTHLVPSTAELETCFAAILDSSRGQRFTPFPGPARHFVRSYNFDSAQRSGAPPFDQKFAPRLATP